MQEAVSLSLPGVVKTALRRGLALVKAGRGGKGLKRATIDAARRGLESGKWPPEKWIKAAAWLARHKVDRRPGWKAKGKETPGFTAWCLWGDSGDGKGWAAIRARAEQIKKERKKMKEQLLIESMGRQLKEAALELPDEMELSDYTWQVEAAGRKAALDMAFEIPAGKPSEVPRFGAYMEFVYADRAVFYVWMSRPGEVTESKYVQVSHSIVDGKVEASDPVFVEVEWKSGHQIKKVAEDRASAEEAAPGLIEALRANPTGDSIKAAESALSYLSGTGSEHAAPLGIALSEARRSRQS